jgi:AcrR family transcriptional regulator
MAGTLIPRINPKYRDDAKKKKKKIIDATLEIAHETGWNTMTLEAIVRKVGVTKGSLYTYFENSAALMEEATFELVRKFSYNIKTDKSGKDVFGSSDGRHSSLLGCAMCKGTLHL